LSATSEFSLQLILPSQRMSGMTGRTAASNGGNERQVWADLVILSIGIGVCTNAGLGCLFRKALNTALDTTLSLGS